MNDKKKNVRKLIPYKHNLDFWLKEYYNKNTNYNFKRNKNLKYKIIKSKSSKNIINQYVKIVKLLKTSKIKDISIKNFVFKNTSNTFKSYYDFIISRYILNAFKIKNVNTTIINDEKELKLIQKQLVNRIDYQKINMSDKQKLEELKNKSKFKSNIIFSNYRNRLISSRSEEWLLHQFKYYIKILKWSLVNITESGIICINLGPPLFKFIFDFLLLMNKFSDIYIFSSFKFNELYTFPVYYCFSSIKNKEQLIDELNKIEKIPFDNYNGFLKVKNNDLSETLFNISNFFINKYQYLTKIYNNDNNISKKDEKIIKKFILMEMINSKLYTSKSIEIITKDKINIDNHILLLNKNINNEVSKYFYRFIIKNKFSKILSIGMNYAIYDIFFILGLKSNKIKGSELVSIDPIQKSKWNNIGIENIKKNKGMKYLKFYEDNPINVLPLLKKNKYIFDLINISDIFDNDYHLVSLFYSSILLKLKGYLIINFSDNPNVIKTINYIDKNLNHILKKKSSPFDNIVFYQKISNKESI